MGWTEIEGNVTAPQGFTAAQIDSAGPDTHSGRPRENAPVVFLRQEGRDVEG